jgi:hypothetical protein
MYMYVPPLRSTFVSLRIADSDSRQQYHIGDCAIIVLAFWFISGSAIHRSK